jgi:hypothetical protein
MIKINMDIRSLQQNEPTHSSKQPKTKYRSRNRAGQPFPIRMCQKWNNNTPLKGMNNVVRANKKDDAACYYA